MRIGILSFRISGLDGVTLEIKRWRDILKRMRHKVTLIAGTLDEKGILIPDLCFDEPENLRLHNSLIKNHLFYSQVKQDIFHQAHNIEKELTKACTQVHFDRLVISNIFSLPIHLSAAIALQKTIVKLQIPAIARHHDFWWERKRYLKRGWPAFFKKYFPPKNPFITHVTINSLAQKELRQRLGINSVVIGDTFDFATSKLLASDSYSRRWRANFGLKPNDIVFLQPTRIISRKKIELSVELIKRLNNPRMILVLSGRAGDEGKEYLAYLKKLVKKAKIRVKFIGRRIWPKRQIKEGLYTYSSWDCFRNCDFVTYPSEVEGFGNQFLEAIYFRKPIMVNRYPVYKADLEPLGFDTVSIDGKVTNQTIGKVHQLLANPQLKKEMVDKNFQIAKKYFSYEATQGKLEKLGF